MTHRAPAAPVTTVLPAPWPDTAKCARCKHSSAVHPVGAWCNAVPAATLWCRCELFRPPAWYRLRAALSRFRDACRPFGAA